MGADDEALPEPARSALVAGEIVTRMVLVVRRRQERLVAGIGPGAKVDAEFRCKLIPVGTSSVGRVHSGPAASAAATAPDP